MEHMAWLVRFPYALVILKLWSQTNVLLYKTRNQGANKLEIILLGSAVFQMIKH